MIPVRIFGAHFLPDEITSDGIAAAVQAPAALGGTQGGSQTTNVTNEYNLTTQSLTPPGGLALEFGVMSMASR